MPPAPRLTLDDLVANGTVRADGAGVLRGIAARGDAFFVCSLPRNAGKSTMVEAVLHESTATRTEFLGTEDEVARLTAPGHRAEGYLVVAEMGHRGRPGYLAGDEIERAFALSTAGYRLASSLHADDVDGFAGVLGANGIDAAHVAAAVRYVVKVQPLGDPFEEGTRRVVEHVFELTGTTSDGRLAATSVYDA